MNTKDQILQNLSKSPSWWRKFQIIKLYYDNIVSGDYTQDMMPVSLVDAKKLKVYIENFNKEHAEKTPKQPTVNKVYNTGTIATDNIVIKDSPQPQTKQEPKDDILTDDNKRNEQKTYKSDKPKLFKSNSKKDKKTS
jgi:hypothetical protein